MSHIRAVPHDDIKTREEINHTKSCFFFFENQTNQVKGREDSTKLINLEIEKERLPQISMTYRGSFIFAFSVMFSLFRKLFFEAVMNGFL